MVPRVSPKGVQDGPNEEFRSNDARKGDLSPICFFTATSNHFLKCQALPNANSHIRTKLFHGIVLMRKHSVEVLYVLTSLECHLLCETIERVGQ